MEPTTLSQLSNQASSPLVDPNITLDPKPSSNKTFFAVIFILIVFLVLGIVGYFYLQSQNTTPQADTSTLPVSTQQPTDSSADLPTSVEVTFSNYLSAAGFTVGIPEGWEVSISNKTDKSLSARIYPIKTDKSTTFVELQIGNSTDFGSNSTLTFDQETKSGTKTLKEGRETLLDSKRNIFQIEDVKGSSKMQLTLFGTSQMIELYRNAIISMISKKEGYLFPDNIFNLVGHVSAIEATPSAETTVIAGFPKSEWKQIDVMSGPYPERISNADRVYKDGYARLYKFDVIAGQRIEALAEESAKSLAEGGSFVETELYDSKGTLILKAGTRVSFSSGKSISGGTYYLIVKSYPNKFGEFMLKVFDLDQVQDLYFAHFADGSELLTNETGETQGKNQDGVLIIHFTSPIEIVGDNQIRYFRKQDNSCLSCGASANGVQQVFSGNFGDVTVPISVTVDGTATPIKLTKLFLNQVIVQPANSSSFAKNQTVNFSLSYGNGSGYGGRFKTY